MRRNEICRTGAVLALCMLAGATGAPAQETLERTPALHGGWSGYPGTLVLDLGSRLHRGAGGTLRHAMTFDATLALPGRGAAGVRFAPQSPAVPGRPDEWEILARYRLLAQDEGAPLDLAAQWGYNTAARSVDAELTLARWAGPLRLIGAARGMTRPFGEDDLGVALAAGAVLHPLYRGAPLALAADVAARLDAPEEERIAWSAGLQVGITHTTHTLSLFATNTASGTVQGVSRGQARTRFGMQLTALVPVGGFLGWFVPRERAREAVLTDVQTPAVVHASMRRYLYAPKRLEIAAGTTVEWVNDDEVVHTVTANDGSWNSGPIRPGERWRATFTEPGTYPFHCAPHPFMQGVVVVR